MSRRTSCAFALLALAAVGCNTTTTNSLPGSSGTTGGTAGPGESGQSGGGSGAIEALCESFFECGEGPEGFDQAACEDLGAGCRETLAGQDPGYFDEKVDACLAATTCGDFDSCFSELLQECSGGETGGCDPDADLPACEGDRIGACVEGQWQSFDCVEICGQDGSSYDSCSYDDASGHDVCWCVSGGDDPALCELGVNALCTCLECTNEEAQSLYDNCVQNGDDVLLCYADQVVDDQITCADAERACS